MTAMQNETTILEPIIKEEDFPQPSSHLEQLMKNYRKEKHLPEQMDKNDNSLPNVQIKNEVKTRSFGDLRPDEKDKVLARIDGIDYMVSGDIQTFGSAKESQMTKQAEVIISKYKANDIGEISGPLTDLVATLKSNNPKEIVSKVSIDPDKKEWGIISSIRDALSMRDAKKKMIKVLAEHDTIKENIQSVVVELKKQQLSLRKDISVYEQMGQGTYNQIAEFEYDCIALNLMIEDATNKLNQFADKSSMDLIELNEYNTLKNAIGRMKRKLYTIQTIRTSTVQNLPQLAVLINGNEIVCEKIDEIESLVVPLWTWQYAIAVGAVGLKEALSIQKTIRGITSKLLVGNAKMLHDNMIAAQEELYAGVIAIKDLLTVQEYLEDMVTKVNESKKEVLKECVEGMKIMQDIEHKNYTLMTRDNVTA